MTTLTKKINIDTDALVMIEQMEWQEDGQGVVGVITSGQLDRNLYDAVNKGLTALGGKWNRKLKGHFFADDPRPRIQEMLGNGFVTVERDGYFPTPSDVVQQMLNMVDSVEFPVLEPSAGMGHICRVVVDECIVATPADIHVVEKNENRRGHLFGAGYTVVGTDFMEFYPAERYSTILMNPPFENHQDAEHIMHAFENCLADGGELVSVCGGGLWFDPDEQRQVTNKKVEAFRCMVEQYGYMVKLEEGSFKESGTGVNTCLVHLNKPSVTVVEYVSLPATETIWSADNFAQMSLFDLVKES